MGTQTAETYHTIAENWVVEADLKVSSADAFYQMLRDTPNYIPRAIAREVWSSYQEQTAWASFRDARDPDSPMLRRFFDDRPSYAQQAYNVKVKYSAFDPETGLPVDSYVTLGFNHPPSMSEVENWALAETDYQPIVPAEAPFTWGIEYLYHREDMEW